jgi:hypothetical protein
VGHVTLVKGLPNLLLRREAGKDQWQNLPPDQPKSTVGPKDTLLALPGYRSDVRFDNGVGLFLWGNLPELLTLPLLESGVTLQPRSDADLEFVLDRGRVVVSNQKTSGPAKVRVRFNETKPKPAEQWDLTLLEPGTEVALELLGRYVPDIPFQREGGEPPVAELNLVVTKGEARVQVDAQTFSLRAPPTGPSVLYWNNYGKGVSPPAQMNPQALALFDKARPQTEAADRAEAALTDLLRRLLSRAPDKPIESVAEESLQADKPERRVLGVLCLGALDAISKVLDALADDDERHDDLREAAVQELRQWLGRRGDRALYDVLVEQKRYTPSQAETIMQLLHGFTEEQLRQVQTWEALIGYLNSDKAPIRTLAYWHLWRHWPDARREAKYNPAGDSKQRDVAYSAWSKLLESGKLPPKPAAPQGTPMPMKTGSP